MYMHILLTKIRNYFIFELCRKRKKLCLIHTLMPDFDKENNFKVGYEIHSFLCNFDYIKLLQCNL